MSSIEHIREAGRAIYRSAFRKLASPSGASIVFAVVAFGISAIFCVTIINAALSSAGNVTNQVADEQDYLAASSAARVLQELVPGKKGAESGNTVVLVGTDEDAAAVSQTCTVSAQDGAAKPLLQAMGDSLLPKNKDTDITVSFNAGDSLPKVTVKMEPAGSGSYDVAALVKTDRGNAMAVNFKGQQVAKDASGVEIKWEVESVGKKRFKSKLESDTGSGNS